MGMKSCHRGGLRERLSPAGCRGRRPGLIGLRSRVLLRLLPPLRTEYRLVTYSSIIVKMQLLEKKNLQQLTADCRIISSRHTVVAVRLKADQLFNEYLTLITQPIPGEELQVPREALRSKIVDFLKVYALPSSDERKRELQIIKLRRSLSPDAEAAELSSLPIKLSKMMRNLKCQELLIITGVA